MNQSALYDHAQFPRCKTDVLHTEHQGHAANPLCGDVIDIGISCEEGVVVRAEFKGSGCALALGGASLLCTWLIGKKVEELGSDAFAHLAGEHVGRMREGCVLVSRIALERAIKKYDACKKSFGTP